MKRNDLQKMLLKLLQDSNGDAAKLIHDIKNSHCNCEICESVRSAVPADQIEDFVKTQLVLGSLHAKHS